MSWPERMQRVIEYFEENLAAEINIDQAARLACCSKFHFHRVFYSMFGVTPADYVRKRRLTVAATELNSGKSKVIDVATKYGYESPNAFTRAFKNLHGINPGKVALGGSKIRAYRRASIKYEGGETVQYTIVQKSAFMLMGKAKHFTFDQFVKQGSKFWKEYTGSDAYKALWNRTKGVAGNVSGAPLMSVYFPDEASNTDAFTDVLGVEVTPDSDSDKSLLYQVPAATYAEFSCTYQTSMKTNRYIYGQWFAATGYERDADKPDIAAYFPVAFRPMKEMGVRWWIPIINTKSG